MKREKAITLISLVITIVIIIILASIAIYLSLGNNGIFTRAKEAKEVTKKQEATDIINLKITTAQINKYAEKQEMPTLKELSEVLRNDTEIAYVTEKSQIASTKYEVGENPISIYTKLNKYPYEFEINGKLQLASINGVKIASTNGDTNILYERSDEDNVETRTLTLNDSISNYKRIKIYYRCNKKNNIEEIYVTNSSISTNIICSRRTQDTNNLKYTLNIITHDIEISDNNLVVSNYMTAYIYPGSSNTIMNSSSGSNLYIDRIIGYKTY